MPVRTARGFTLIEVLMALTVLAIALAAILRTIGQSIDLTVDLRDRQLAAWVAQNRLITHQLQRDWPSATATDGTTELLGREWRWHEQVSTTPEPALRRIEIEIRAATGEQQLARLIGFLEEPQQ
jgi:general secretion pathway protein I